jgi:20S proteasome alpha/beta subunit
MITAGDIEYEPPQLKVGQISDRILVLIAGEYPMHSEAVAKTIQYARGRSSLTPHDSAMFYGSQIQLLQRKQAEDQILAPLGLNTDTFMAQQKEMFDAFVATIKGELQDYPGADIEALIVGIESENAHLYSVDRRGTVRAFDAVGFDAIGIGAAHAKSVFMQAGYTNRWTLAPALSLIYSAKKAAEIAPGVGTNTDIHIILRDGIWRLDQWLPHVNEGLRGIYSEFVSSRERLFTESITKVQDLIDAPQKEAAETTDATGQPSERPTAEAPGDEKADGGRGG